MYKMSRGVIGHRYRQARQCIDETVVDLCRCFLFFFPKSIQWIKYPYPQERQQKDYERAYAANMEKERAQRNWYEHFMQHDNSILEPLPMAAADDDHFWGFPLLPPIYLAQGSYSMKQTIANAHSTKGFGPKCFLDCSTKMRHPYQRVPKFVPFICVSCGRKFNDEYALNRHVNGSSCKCLAGGPADNRQPALLQQKITTTTTKKAKTTKTKTTKTTTTADGAANKMSATNINTNLNTSNETKSTSTTETAKNTTKTEP